MTLIRSIGVPIKVQYPILYSSNMEEEMFRYKINWNLFTAFDLNIFKIGDYLKSLNKTLYCVIYNN